MKTLFYVFEEKDPVLVVDELIYLNIGAEVYTSNSTFRVTKQMFQCEEDKLMLYWVARI